MSPEYQLLFANANLLLLVLTTIAAICAAIFAAKTYKAQAKQVETMQQQLADSREAERVRIRANAPEFELANHDDILRHCSPSTYFDGDILHEGSGHTASPICRMYDEQEILKRKLAIVNIFPDNVPLWVSARRVSGPRAVTMDGTIRPMWGVGERVYKFDLFFVDISGPELAFLNGEKVVFRLAYQTSTGHIIEQQYRYALGGRKLEKLPDPQIS